MGGKLIWICILLLNIQVASSLYTHCCFRMSHNMLHILCNVRMLVVVFYVIHCPIYILDYTKQARHMCASASKDMQLNCVPVLAKNNLSYICTCIAEVLTLKFALICRCKQFKVKFVFTCTQKCQFHLSFYLKESLTFTCNSIVPSQSICA